jgi:hypothetical protein
MILRITTSIIKLFLAGIAMLSLSVLLITISSMAYGGIVDAVKTHQKQSG